MFSPKEKNLIKNQHDLCERIAMLSPDEVDHPGARIALSVKQDGQISKNAA